MKAIAITERETRLCTYAKGKGINTVEGSYKEYYT